MYVAFTNTPGYLPDTADEHPRFDTPQEAWTYLATLREEEESEADGDGPVPAYTATVGNLWYRAKSWSTGPGSIQARTPGYTGDHDLGRVYNVEAVEANEEESAAAQGDAAEATRKRQAEFLASDPDLLDVTERAAWHAATARSIIAGSTEGQLGLEPRIYAHALLAIASSLEELVFIREGQR